MEKTQKVFQEKQTFANKCQKLTVHTKKFSYDITQRGQAWKFSSRILLQPSIHTILERDFLKITV